MEEMNKSFVDTGAWFATFVPTDPNHAAAVEYFDSHRFGFITTDYVLDELFTLLKTRGEYRRAQRVGDALLQRRIAEVVTVGSHDFNEAWNTYIRFRDKDWSFTDCTSRAVMLRLGIKEAFAFDVHFRQFGTVRVLP